MHNLALERRHRIEPLRHAGPADLLGDLPAQLGQLLPAVCAVPAHIQHDPAARARLAMHGQAGEFLQGLQDFAAGPDKLGSASRRPRTRRAGRPPRPCRCRRRDPPRRAGPRCSRPRSRSPAPDPPGSPRHPPESPRHRRGSPRPHWDGLRSGLRRPRIRPLRRALTDPHHAPLSQLREQPGHLLQWSHRFRCCQSAPGPPSFHRRSRQPLSPPDSRSDRATARPGQPGPGHGLLMPAA